MCGAGKEISSIYCNITLSTRATSSPFHLLNALFSYYWRVHVNPIKRDFKSLLVIRNREEIQRLNESNKFYKRVNSLVWRGTGEWEGEKGRVIEKKEKKQRKSAYTPVNYCLACLTRFMRVRSVSITGLKELKTTYIETKAITRQIPNKTANHLG